MSQVQKNYNFVFVRKDLPLCQQIVQASHASYETGTKFQKTYPSKNYLILCEVPDEASLLFALDRLNHKGIQAHLFREPDRNNEATAFCTEPVKQPQRKLFSKFKLWKGE